MKRWVLFLFWVCCCAAFCLLPACDCGEESEEIEGYETPWGNWDTGNNATSEDCYDAVEYLFEQCNYSPGVDQQEMTQWCVDVAKVDWKNCLVSAVAKNDNCSDQTDVALSCEAFLDENQDDEL